MTSSKQLHSQSISAALLQMYINVLRCNRLKARAGSYTPPEVLQQSQAESQRAIDLAQVIVPETPISLEKDYTSNYSRIPNMC